jgi:putative peptidoglycan lipid II flippase
VMVTILIVPSVLGLAAISKPVVELLFEHGETGPGDARLIVIALLGYLPGTLFAAYDQVLIYTFYARRNTWWPVLVGIAATLVYFAVAIPCGRAWGMIGLVLANSAQFFAHFVIMAILARRVLGTEGWYRLRPVVLRCLIAGMGMAAVVLAVWLALDAILPESTSTIVRVLMEFIAVGVPAVAGLIIFAYLMHRTGVDEAAELRRTVLGKLHPTFAR